MSLTEYGVKVESHKADIIARAKSHGLIFVMEDHAHQVAYFRHIGAVRGKHTIDYPAFYTAYCGYKQQEAQCPTESELEEGGKCLLDRKNVPEDKMLFSHMDGKLVSERATGSIW